MCKLETLLQTEVTVMTTGVAVGTDAAKTPPGLRRRKRTCSRRQGEREREREGGGAGGGDRGDRGVGEERDTREAGKSARIQTQPASPASVQYRPLVVVFGFPAVQHNLTDF